MLNKLEIYLGPVAEKLNNNKTLMSVRDGLMYTTPLIIPASVFLLIQNLPINGYADFMAGVFGPNWSAYLGSVTGATINIIALLNVLGIGHAYAKALGSEGIIGSIVAFVSFLVLIPQRHAAYINEAERSFAGFDYSHIGAQGLFLGIMVAIISVRIYVAIERKGWVIKMPDGVPHNVAVSFSALIPASFSLVTFFFLRVIFAQTSFGFAQEFIYAVLQAPLMVFSKTPIFPIIYTFFAQLFWFFGVHGASVVNSVFGPIMTAAGYENLAVFQQFGMAGDLPNIFTHGFYNFFGNAGGGGATLSLIVCMLVFGKSQRMKSMSKLSLVPGIFGINEMVIFGFPIVLNPLIIIPFILTPMVNVILAFIATNLGWLPRVLGIPVPWTTPIFISGWLGTGSWLGAFWQLIFLLIGVAIYYPFFKILDNQYVKEEQSATSVETDELDEISLEDLSFD